MRTVMFLMILSVLVTALTGYVLAVPLCSQIDPNFCVPLPNCQAEIQWRGSCADETREWRCHFLPGPGCVESYGNWVPCCCSNCSKEDGCDCLLEGTPITLADGSTKPVEAIRPGDRVLAYDESLAKLNPSEVVAVHAPYVVTHYFIINEEIRLTENHPVLSGGKWVAAGELRVGDVLTGADGLDTPIFSMRKIDEKATVYNFQVAAGTYVAQGIIAHNKEDCEVYRQYPGQ